MDPDSNGQARIGRDAGWPDDIDAQAVLTHAKLAVLLRLETWAPGPILVRRPGSIPGLVQGLGNAEAVQASSILGIGDSEEDVLVERRQVQALVGAVQDLCGGVSCGKRRKHRGGKEAPSPSSSSARHGCNPTRRLRKRRLSVRSEGAAEGRGQRAAVSHAPIITNRDPVVGKSARAGERVQVRRRSGSRYESE